MIRISVIIPVFNGELYLAGTLDALRNSSVSPLECVVVDDGSSDRSAAIAESFGCLVIPSGQRRGPAAARNLGAQAARGSVLVFLDADVCLHSDALQRMTRHFETQPMLAAAFGSYDLAPQHPAFVSQFRNLLHCHTHQTGNPEASTFWAACGAVRRDWFERAGGFRTRYVRPSIEDIDLGYRIKAAGGGILLDRTILATHQKRWTMWSTMRTDVFDRAAPWTRLILESGRCPDDLNLRKSRRVSAALGCAGALLFAMAAAGWNRTMLCAAGATAMAGSILLDRDFYRFLRKARGVGFAAGTVPLYLLFHVYSGAGFLVGAAQYASARLRRRPLALEDVEAEDSQELRAQLH